jgi:hypothetical protein
MSVTNENQIQKSRLLIDGFRKHINELQAKGVTENELKRMESDLEALSAANKECDAIRAEMRAKSQNARKILTDVKEIFVEKKKIIKSNYPQEEWIKYGVTDKR